MLTKELKESFIEDIFCEEPLEAEAAYTILSKLKNGDYDQSFINIIMQKLTYAYDIADAFYFGKVLNGLIKGEIYSLAIDINHTPSKDNQITDNNFKLKSLKEPFFASFNPLQGAGTNADGNFSWSNSIIFLNQNGKQYQAEPLTIPLEVGFTDAWTTYFHLYTYEKAVARWAYEDGKIHILMKK